MPHDEDGDDCGRHEGQGRGDGPRREAADAADPVTAGASVPQSGAEANQQSRDDEQQWR